ncbi:MAG: hypothetical protein ACMG57_04475 [Candidatus Dojkabacteria bacterium]
MAIPGLELPVIEIPVEDKTPMPEDLILIIELADFAPELKAHLLSRKDFEVVRQLLSEGNEQQLVELLVTLIEG